MAEENKIANGVALENEDEAAAAAEEKETKLLKQRIESLEKENEEMKDEAVKVTAEIESLRSKESEAEEGRKALEVVAARASELETQVFRLQHDLISSVNEGEESKNEIKELKELIGEKEAEIEELKKEKLEIEKKVRELERKIGVLEVKELEERSKRLRVEEEMRDKIDAKDNEISIYKDKLVELEVDRDKKIGELQDKVLELEEKLWEMKNVGDGDLEERSLDDGMMKNTQWPIVAIGSTGAVVAVAAVMVYVCCARRS